MRTYTKSIAGKYLIMLACAYFLLGLPIHLNAQTIADEDKSAFSAPRTSNAGRLKIPAGDYLLHQGSVKRGFSIESVPGFSVYKLNAVNTRDGLYSDIRDITFELEWNEVDQVFRAEKRVKALTGCYWKYKIDVRVDDANRIYFREWTPDKIELNLNHIGSNCAVSSEGWHYFDKQAEYSGIDSRTFAENLVLSQDPGLVERGRAQIAAINGNFEEIEAYRQAKGKLPQSIPELDVPFLYAAAYGEHCIFLIQVLNKYPSELTSLLNLLPSGSASFIDLASSGKKCTADEKKILAESFLRSGDFVNAATMDNIFVTIRNLNSLENFQKIYRDSIELKKASGNYSDLEDFNQGVFRTLLRIRTMYEAGSDDSVLKYIGFFLDEKPRFEIKSMEYLFASWIVYENLPDWQRKFFDAYDANAAQGEGREKIDLYWTFKSSIYTARRDFIDELETRNMTVVESEKMNSISSSLIRFYIYNSEKLNAQFIEYLITKGATKNPEYGKSPLDALVDRYKHKDYENEKKYIADTGKWMMQVGFRLKERKEIPW